MVDVASEVKDAPVVEKEVEKPALTEDENTGKLKDIAKNGDAKQEKSDGKIEHGDGENEKLVENGTAKKNEESVEISKINEGEVCSIKRKSEVGLESDDVVESCEKKQKVEEADEPEVASNSVC